MTQKKKAEIDLKKIKRIDMKITITIPKEGFDSALKAMTNANPKPIKKKKPTK